MALNGIPFTVIGVAPAGFHGTAQVAQEFDVIVPMAAYDAVNRSTQAASPNYWWVLVMARLRPGVRLEQVQPAADLIVKRTTAETRPQLTRGRSAAGGARARKPRADREPQLGPRAAHDDGAGHRHRAAGRLRQCRQPDARARPRPREGADRPRRDRRGTCPRGPAAGDGRTAARRRRRRARAAAGQVRGRRTAAGAHRVGVHPRRCGALLARWSVHDGGGDGLHAAVRRRPGAARDRSAARLGASGGGAGQHRRPPAQPAGRRARGPAGRVVDAAGDGGGAAGHLAARTRTDRPWLRSRERARLPARSAPERLRRAARAPPDGERARAPARHSRRAGGVVLEPPADCGTVRHHRGTAGGSAVSRVWRPRVAAIHRRASRLAPGRRRGVPLHRRHSACNPAGSFGHRTARERRRSR